MDTSLLQLKAFYSEMGINTATDTINKRLVLQKVALLGQEMGVPLGYSYNWYVKGPYSPSLTADYYELDGSSTENEFQFNEEIKGKLKLLSEEIDSSKYTEIRHYWVEALASILFLIKKSYKKEEDALEFIKNKKTHLGQDLLSDAVSSLKKLGLI